MSPVATIRGLAFNKLSAVLLASGVRVMVSLDSLCWNSSVTAFDLLVIPPVFAIRKSLCERFLSLLWSICTDTGIRELPDKKRLSLV